VSQIQLQIFSCICSKQDRNLQTIEKDSATGSILDTKNMQEIYANQGKVDETGATLETSPRKSLVWHAPANWHVFFTGTKCKKTAVFASM